MIGNIVKAAFFILVVYAAVAPILDKQNQAQKVSVETEQKQQEPKKPVPKPVVEPEIVVSELPDFSQYRDVKQKKRAFFSYLRPYVEQINTDIEAKRSFVKGFEFGLANEQDSAKLNKLFSRYKVKSVVLNDKESLEQGKKKLLRHLDVIPVELVLMQAANESAWGTSRFALQANNLFGQWCFKPGCGVVPAGRPEGETYEVRKFNSPKDSIRSYFYNINVGHAYGELRTLRETLRAMNESLDPYVIAEGLLPYSTRREAYVDEIQNMIRINKKYI